MHDVDRTLREFESEFESVGETMEMGEFGELGEQESEQQGFLGALLGGEMETGEFGETQESFLGETLETHENFLGESSQEAVFDEVQEMELAAELLEVGNEQELEQFLGKLIRGATKMIGKVAKGPIGQALGPVLKKVAKTALPIAGSALGNFLVPGLGGAVGGKLASAAGRMFGLELEGLSPQDREFEVARRFVRFAGASAQRAARIPPTVPPQRAVCAAVVGAARRHAPGLLQPISGRRGRPQRGVSRGGRGGYGGGGGRQPVNAPSYSPSYAQNYGFGQGGDQSGYDAGGSNAPVDTPSYTGSDAGWNGDGSTGAGRSGRWVRRGRRIVLYGL